MKMGVRLVLAHQRLMLIIGAKRALHPRELYGLIRVPRLIGRTRATQKELEATAFQNGGAGFFFAISPYRTCLPFRSPTNQSTILLSPPRPSSQRRFANQGPPQAGWTPRRPTQSL